MSITVGSSTITVNSGAVMADPPGTAGLFFARAWVNFNGTGTVAIRASGNVSSITDVGPGDYTVNFTTNITDANYGVLFGSGGGSVTNPTSLIAGAITTSSFAARAFQGENVAFDQALCFAAVLR